jgi:hypothetical protein
MKIIFTLACSAAMIWNFAHGQDTTLAKIDQMQSPIKKDAPTEIEAPVTDVEEVSAARPEPTFRLPVYSGKHSILNNKVGPNGEELLMKKNKYYYINGAGKKVNARSANLGDKPKSS